MPPRDEHQPDPVAPVDARSTAPAPPRSWIGRVLFLIATGYCILCIPACVEGYWGVGDRRGPWWFWPVWLHEVCYTAGWESAGHVGKPRIPRHGSRPDFWHVIHEPRRIPPHDE